MAELTVVHQTLAPGGRLFIFVPALRWLYGSIDRQIGHFHRYTHRELHQKCEGVGFSIVKSRYFDSAGILTWWLKYRLLKSQKMEPAAVRLYDKFVIPPLKLIESLVSPPIGKNILLIGEKV